MYVLEVVRFIEEKDGLDGWVNKKGKLEHIGYMNAKFRTKKDACSYYDRHNQHMRALNQHNTYKSDYDPNTHLLYMVREDFGIISTIDPFDKNDLPIVEVCSDGWMAATYNYLK